MLKEKIQIFSKVLLFSFPPFSPGKFLTHLLSFSLNFRSPRRHLKTPEASSMLWAQYSIYMPPKHHVHMNLPETDLQLLAAEMSSNSWLTGQGSWFWQTGWMNGSQGVSPAAAASPGNELKMQIFKCHTWPTESGTVGQGPSNLTKTTGDYDACWIERHTGTGTPKKKKQGGVIQAT